MRNEIQRHINDAKELEKLFRSNPLQFKQSFLAIYPEIEGNGLASFWNERLSYQGEDLYWGKKKEFLVVLILSFLAGIAAKLPALIQIGEEFFYTRNIGFLVFPSLTFYFYWKNKVSVNKMAIVLGLFVLSNVFINLFPNNPNSDTLTLSCIHILLFLWSVFGYSFVGEFNNIGKRLDFLKFNGDFVVMSGLILIAGAITTAITINLFLLIGIKIETFYFNYIIVFGLTAVPNLAAFLIQNNPQIVGKVSPVIARIFSPLVLVMLVVYSIAIFYSGNDPYNDREFLLLFNALLIGVMAIIFFSVAESGNVEKSKAEKWVLFLLSVMTILVNGIALSAILFRISTMGITPNRLAVLGGNLIMLINLILVTFKLYKLVRNEVGMSEVGKQIALFLPIYTFWTILVAFIFPFIFGFK